MSTHRGKYICNIAYIIPNFKYIRNADMNELGERTLLKGEDNYEKGRS